MTEPQVQAVAAPAIVRLRDSADLAQYEIDPGLGAFAGYSRRRAEVVRQALGSGLRVPGGEAFVAVAGGVIVAYLLLVPAGPDQPWGRLNDPRILEIGIEVARGHRGRGLAQALFREAFSRPEVESRIYVATAYVWCWDVEASGISAHVYADRLLRLFERFGFRREWTNEPNITMEPANFLAVRVGREVPAALLRRFRSAQRGERAA
ncbi:MAG: GNAT family N-acetyltransferase [Armatimonadota bacterium]|nr:GNAT family N-acetyltransferase [Armatimonadota bacterium]MDR7453773.1 GNAT family N-acetyltransferase [Armatimonadota bacterium]MDR7456301.1 GNAT family N-acetyltransferase [Armatimonadota bacterium]MDR7496298.1 GNAT family N-acetyltransferase [Armatimonadota bacterium]MDR7512213.1 GNAT family N-acetyltransferase [Armatimonadota bacterium]